MIAACAFGAGLVRGFSGFGLSAVLVASCSFFIAPRLIIPTAQALEIVASVALLRSVWADVSWRWLAPMALGYVFAIPLGVAALAYLPESTLRVVGCVILLTASLCLLFNVRPRVRDGLPLRLSTGLGAGFLAGASSLGGMLASVMLFAAELPPKNLRATLIVLFFGSALYSLSWGAWHGIVSAETFVRAAWLAPTLLIGVAVGTRGFAVVTPEQFKRWVLILLAVLAVAGVISVAFGK